MKELFFFLLVVSLKHYKHVLHCLSRLFIIIRCVLTVYTRFVSCRLRMRLECLSIFKRGFYQSSRLFYRVSIVCVCVCVCVKILTSSKRMSSAIFKRIATVEKEQEYIPQRNLHSIVYCFWRSIDDEIIARSTIIFPDDHLRSNLRLATKRDRKRYLGICQFH